MSTYALTNSWLSPLVRAVESHGKDPRELLVGELDILDLADPANAWIDHDSMTRLWKRAAAITNDPAIGLLAAGYIGPATFGSLSFAMNASDSALTALRVLVRFHEIGSSAATWSMRTDAEHVELTQKMRGPLGAYEQKDANVAAVLNICRSIGDPQARYDKLIIGRPAPADTSAWQAFFGIEPEFRGNGESFMRFARRPLEVRCPTYEPELFELSHNLLEQRLKQMASSTFLATVKGHIIEGLEHGPVHIDQIADRVGLSRRSFQRRLWKECHFTFSQLFQEVRMALARRYLSSSRRSIEEVSDMLGYANVSSFSRSFRKLAGMTPSAFRNQNIDQGIDYLEPIGPL